MSSIVDVAKISLQNKKQMREDRTFMIIGYLKLHPDQTVYHLHKHFNWPLSSIHSILKELLEDTHLKFRTITENSRIKKLYSLRVEDDFIIQYYKARTLLVPMNMRLAKNAQSKGFDIQIEMPDGEIIDVKPSYSIDKFIIDYDIKLDLED